MLQNPKNITQKTCSSVRDPRVFVSCALERRVNDGTLYLCIARFCLIYRALDVWKEISALQIVADEQRQWTPSVNTGVCTLMYCSSYWWLEPIVRWNIEREKRERREREGRDYFTPILESKLLITHGGDAIYRVK